MTKTLHRFFLPLILITTGCAEPAAPTAEPPPSGPPTTDIHLFSLESGSATHVARVTDRDGYDNQPHFTPRGQLLFTSDRSGNMDTHLYDPASGLTTQVTTTEEGEYSPTRVPGEEPRFSVIRMDTAGVQELWSYPLGDGAPPARIADVDRVGYHTWVGEDRLLFFRLGSPATLQLITAGTADTLVVASRVGRSLHRIPGDAASSYLAPESDEYAEIRRYDWATGESSALAVALSGQADYTWSPDGAILMAVDGVLYRYKPGESIDWDEFADLGLEGTSRMAVSHDGTLLAVVASRQ